MSDVPIEVIQEKMDAARERFEQLCHLHGQPMDVAKVTLRIEKARRRLQLLHGNSIVKEYPVRIGQSPVGSKSREGDCMTPVGKYYICYRNPESRFHFFLGLSYPNAEDARAGLAAGLITEEKCREICAAISRKECPDWYTALGGEVGIHGGGIDRPGTLGCIALRDEDIEELWGATRLGTPVEILE